MKQATAFSDARRLADEAEDERASAASPSSSHQQQQQQHQHHEQQGQPAWSPRSEAWRCLSAALASTCDALHLCQGGAVREAVLTHSEAALRTMMVRGGGEAAGLTAGQWRLLALAMVGGAGRRGGCGADRCAVAAVGIGDGGHGIRLCMLPPSFKWLLCGMFARVQVCVLSSISSIPAHGRDVRVRIPVVPQIEGTCPVELHCGPTSARGDYELSIVVLRLSLVE